MCGCRGRLPGTRNLPHQEGAATPGERALHPDLTHPTLARNPEVARLGATPLGEAYRGEGHRYTLAG